MILKRAGSGLLGALIRGIAQEMVAEYHVLESVARDAVGLKRMEAEDGTPLIDLQGRPVLIPDDKSTPALRAMNARLLFDVAGVTASRELPGRGDDELPAVIMLPALDGRDGRYVQLPTPTTEAVSEEPPEAH